MSDLLSRLRQGVASSSQGESENLERKRRAVKAKLDELREQNIIVNDPSLARQIGLVDAAKEAQKQAGMADYLNANPDVRDRIIREEIAKKEREVYLQAKRAKEENARRKEQKRIREAQAIEDDERLEAWLREGDNRQRQQRRREQQFILQMRRQRAREARLRDAADLANEERARALGETKALDKITKGLADRIRERRAIKEAERLETRQQAMDAINRVLGEKIRTRRARAAVPEVDVEVPEFRPEAPPGATPSRRGRPPLSVSVGVGPTYRTALNQLSKARPDLPLQDRQRIAFEKSQGVAAPPTVARKLTRSASFDMSAMV